MLLFVRCYQSLLKTLGVRLMFPLWHGMSMCVKLLFRKLKEKDEEMHVFFVLFNDGDWD